MLKLLCRRRRIVAAVVSGVLLQMTSLAFAGGMFGPPQTLSKKEGGINTAIAYRYAEETFQSHTRQHTFRQNQIYSQAAYGAANLWEVYGRVGVADLRISDAFASSRALTVVSKNDFEENWKFFGTLGGKLFYPATDWFGLGTFVQGTYHFSNYTDDIVGAYDATPFVADLKIKNLWDVHFGISLQVTILRSIKIYGGPYAYYAQAEACLPAAVPGLPPGAGDDVWKNKSSVGGFVGADVALFKGFRLNIEGQYADHFSIGSAVTYTY